MTEEVHVNTLKKSLGHPVEVLAFGLAYRGTLKKIDTKNGTIQIVDGTDYVVLEMERIEAFKDVGKDVGKGR